MRNENKQISISLNIFPYHSNRNNGFTNSKMLWNWDIFLDSGFYPIANIFIPCSNRHNFCFSGCNYRVSSEVKAWQKVRSQEKII